ncbi:GNAT family N-acetyltransferase [Sphingomonas sp. BIUV-7]|uniref:GNAT family N-acetyltransferase n=1 Tax=Sphingomonas natans TaxID=3063330 RepID=A0ABT8YBK8_9SPHN|nr:GNAT family N-acetyltransferase [Sphingomonas sp. BIUV-7]MDO6415689.1 GNAT family N-acetyltransferase [Sphingomonas sp. BIUV-7]
MGLHYRDATEADLPAIVALLADDPLGALREDPSLPLAASYGTAFAAIASAPHQRLIVAEEEGRVVGTLQLLLIPAISRRGSWRGQIEGVRIAADRRGNGHGEAFVRWAADQCRSAGCVSVQLTSDASREAAHRFWRRLGFEATHVGFKMSL